MYGYESPNQYPDTPYGYSMLEVSKKVGVGRTTLMKALRELGILEGKVATARYVDEGYFFNQKSRGYGLSGPNEETVRAKAKGITLIMDLIERNPEVFRRRG